MNPACDARAVSLRRALALLALALALVLAGSSHPLHAAAAPVLEFAADSPPLALREFTVKAPPGKWQVNFGEDNQSVLLTGGGPTLWKVLTIGDYKADVLIGAGCSMVSVFGPHVPTDSAAVRYLRDAYRDLVWDYRPRGRLPDGPPVFGLARLHGQDVHSIRFRLTGVPPLRIVKVAFVPDDFLVSRRLYSVEMLCRGHELWPEEVPPPLANMVESIEPVRPEPVGSDPEHRILLACARGDTGTVSALLASGVQPDLVLNHGTPLTAACANGQAGTVSLLLQHQARTTVEYPAAQMTALQLAAGGGSAETVRLLLDHGAEIEHRDEDAWTAVHYAAMAADSGALRELLARGARADERATSGTSPLMLAARNGCTQNGRMLIAAGADVNAANRSGYTPLMLAAYSGDAELLSALLERGADVARTLPSKATALHLAAERGSLECARRLVAAGADPRAAKENGATPLKAARAANDRAMVEVLERGGKR